MMTVISIDRVFEQISEMISTCRPFRKEDIAKMVKYFSVEQIWILSGRLAFLKAERGERYEENIRDIKDQTVHAFGGSMSGFYDEDASLQFIGFQEKAQKIDKIIDFLRQISKDLF